MYRLLLQQPDFLAVRARRIIRFVMARLALLSSPVDAGSGVAMSH
jgi:hypothetical protein